MAPKRSTHGDDSISLNKFISDSGFCSRRVADEYIDQARVTINDEPAQAGNRVYPGDVVEIDGEPLGKKVKTVYIALHKPAGVTCTTDQKDKTNIIDFVGYKQRIFPIGRLDKDSEGLIFLTNDGNIVNKVLRAGNQHEKEYVVIVDKLLSPDFLKKMAAGVRILGKYTNPCKVTQEGKHVFRIVLTQGMNRQIRRMCEALDHKVVKLKRVRIMNVTIGSLPIGKWRLLTTEEVDVIQKMVTNSDKTEAASTVRKTAPVAKKPTAFKEPAPARAVRRDEIKKPAAKADDTAKTTTGRATKGKPATAGKGTSGKVGGGKAAAGKPKPGAKKTAAGNSVAKYKDFKSKKK